MGAHEHRWTTTVRERRLKATLTVLTESPTILARNSPAALAELVPDVV